MANLNQELLGLHRPTRSQSNVNFSDDSRGWPPFLLILSEKKVIWTLWHSQPPPALSPHEEFLKFESIKFLHSFCNHLSWPSAMQTNHKLPKWKILLSSCFYLIRSQLVHFFPTRTRHVGLAPNWVLKLGATVDWLIDFGNFRKTVSEIFLWALRPLVSWKMAPCSAD